MDRIYGIYIDFFNHEGTENHEAVKKLETTNQHQ